MKKFFLTLFQGMVIIIAFMFLTLTFLNMNYLDGAFILSTTTSLLTIIFIIGLWLIANKIIKERMINDKNEDKK